MRQLRRYAYLNARVSSMAAMLLAPTQLEALIGSTAEGRSKPLRAAGLVFLTDHALDSQELEQSLTMHLLSEIKILLRPLSGAAHAFLLFWMRKYELANLKLILRSKLLDESRSSLQSRLVDLGQFALLPTESLLRTENTAELLRVLEITPFRHIARSAFQIYSQRQDLFALDASIEQAYFSGLYHHFEALEESEQDHLHPLVGGLIDQLNLTWLLRYRFTYSLAPAEAFYFTIPGGYALNSWRLKTLSQLGSVEEVVKHLPPVMATLLADKPKIPQIERLLDQMIINVAQRLLNRTLFNLARAIAYLHLREKQLSHIRGILNGTALGLPEEMIREAAGLSRSVSNLASVGNKTHV